MSMGRSAEAVPILLAAAKAAGRWQGAIQFHVRLMAAAALRDQGRLREALAVMDEGLKLPADSPLLAMAGLEVYIDILTVMGEQSRALEKAKAAFALIEAQDEEWMAQNWKQSVSVLRTIAWAERRCGNPEQGLVAIRKAELLAQPHQDEIESISAHVATLYRIAAEIQLEDGALDEAMEWIRRAVIAAGEAPQFRDDTLRIQLAFSCSVRARVLAAMGGPGEAVDWFAQAHKELEGISNPSARTHAMAGVYYHQSFTANRTEAVSWASKSLEAYQSLAAAFPERWRRRVAEAHVFLAGRMRDAGMASEAAAQYGECLAFLADDESEFARKLRGQIESALSAA